MALWRDPDVLALDEPTHHIYADARRMLLAALHRYRGVGLLVSHDHRFLQALTTIRRHITAEGDDSRLSVSHW